MPGHLQDKPKIQIRAQGLPPPHAVDVSALANRAVLRAFLERRPDVTGDGMDTGPLMAIVAGIPPNAIYVNYRQSSTYLSQEFLVPVEVLLARLLSDDSRVREYDEEGRWLGEAEVTSAIRERVPDPAWPVVYRADESGQYAQPHAWAVPTSTLVMALQYRKDLFAAAGLDPERGPADWEEMREYTRLLTVPERQQYGLSVEGGNLLSWGIYTFLVSAGARAVEQDADGTWRASYGTREAAEAVGFFRGLANDTFERDGRTLRRAAYIGTNERGLMWYRGQVAMRFAYMDEEPLGEINPQLVGIAPVPIGPSGERGCELNSRMVGIYSGPDRLSNWRSWITSGSSPARMPIASVPAFM
ncbi:extracellular solute-binding protein [Phycisphaerales bacterium AB-hyl4]|uniref:Extracellular solute-binding protein n=1 Tax=Natronomicrosphaera hydrolytica TaxID=3242702 RepID=A0ABV4U441_9BACT